MTNKLTGSPHPNGSTVTKCKGGCAAIPDTAFSPTIECPKLELIIPEDACICPYVVCIHPRNAIIPPPRLPNAFPNFGLHQRPPLTPIGGAEHPHSSSPRPAASHPALVSSDPKGCPFRGKTIPFGHEVYDGCRAVCHCGPDGEMNCGLIDCPHHFGSQVSECPEWEIDPEFELAPPNCCPKMKCKPSGSCMFAGLPVENFKAVPSDMLPCGTKCVCLNGNITCESRCSALSDIPPVSLPCPDHMKFKGHAKGETCCLQWMCRDEENTLTGNYSNNLSKLSPESSSPSSSSSPHHSLKSDELRPYYIALTIMALFAAVTSIAFLSLLCVILRSKSSAKAPITRSLSDQAFDNPTYKACDCERTGSNDLKILNNRNQHHVKSGEVYKQTGAHQQRDED